MGSVGWCVGGCGSGRGGMCWDVDVLGRLWCVGEVMVCCEVVGRGGLCCDVPILGEVVLW